MSKEKANAKLLLFATEYLKHFNGTKAAIAAGYSPKTAAQKACGLLNDPRVIKILADFRAEVKADAILSFEERARILSEIARGKIADVVKVNDGGLVDLKLSHEHANRAAIMEIDQKILSEEQGGGIATKIKLRDPVPAIRELNEMFGDHAPKRLISQITGTIENMTDEQLEAELERLNAEAANIREGKKKAD